MKKLLMTAALLMSGSAAYAAEPGAVSELARACCAAVAACCELALGCCG